MVQLCKLVVGMNKLILVAILLLRELLLIWALHLIKKRIFPYYYITHSIGIYTYYQTLNLQYLRSLEITCIHIIR